MPATWRSTTCCVDDAGVDVDDEVLDPDPGLVVEVLLPPDSVVVVVDRHGVSEPSA